MVDQLIITAILLAALVLFVQDRIRPDAVALLALLACHLTGLLTVREALDGFSSRAVITVAAILIIGRVMEVTGAASALARMLVPRVRFVSIRLAAIMLVAAALSAFMNNIAALVIMMPATIGVAREHKLPPSALLMSLAFATVLGGMTTLIGTPGNLILSSVREDALGTPFHLFDMTYVGGMVAGAGLLYLGLVGWRLTPRRSSGETLEADPARTFELRLPIGAYLGTTTVADVRRQLRGARAVLLAVFRDEQRVRLNADDRVGAGDRVLVMARDLPWDVAARAGFFYDHPRSPAANALVARVTVAHGSRLIGLPYAAVPAQSQDAVQVIAVGPRPARLRRPLESLRIEAGDQLFLHGPESALVPFEQDMRLLEIERQTMAPISVRPALTAFAIYAAAVAAAGLFALPVAIVMVTAALAMCLARLIPAGDIYRSIDWQVIVLLAAVIPIGRAFDSTGATDSVASGLSWVLASASLPIAVAVLCGATMLLSSFLNNVATAVVMGQVGVEAARTMGIDVDAALLAVLVGSSCSFLTPIAHQNNLLVMRPGGYRFDDYARVGLPLTAIVIAVTTAALTSLYG